VQHDDRRGAVSLLAEHLVPDPHPGDLDVRHDISSLAMCRMG
jgi:hypothetical protein